MPPMIYVSSALRLLISGSTSIVITVLVLVYVPSGMNYDESSDPRLYQATQWVNQMGWKVETWLDEADGSPRHIGDYAGERYETASAIIMIMYLASAGFWAWYATNRLLLRLASKTNWIHAEASRVFGTHREKRLIGAMCAGYVAVPLFFISLTWVLNRMNPPTLENVHPEDRYMLLEPKAKR